MEGLGLHSKCILLRGEDTFGICARPVWGLNWQILLRRGASRLTTTSRHHSGGDGGRGDDAPVTGRRRAGFSSGALASTTTTSKLSCVRQSPRPSSLPPSVEAAERTRKRLHTVTCYHPAYSQKWRDTDWFKTRVPDQTQKRSLFIQSVNRPSPSTLHKRTRADSTKFSCQWVGRRPMRNSEPSKGPQGSQVILLNLLVAFCD